MVQFFPRVIWIPNEFIVTIKHPLFGRRRMTVSACYDFDSNMIYINRNLRTSYKIYLLIHEYQHHLLKIIVRSMVQVIFLSNIIDIIDVMFWYKKAVTNGWKEYNSKLSQTYP